MVWNHYEEGLVRKWSRTPGLMDVLDEKWAIVRDEPYLTPFLHSRSGQPKLADKIAIIECHAIYEAGGFCLVKVEIGSGPPADAERDLMQEVLSDLPEPFAAQIATTSVGLLTADGVVSWDQPIRVTAATAKLEAAPHAVPLEVGSYQAARAHYALGSSGPGLAMWPYRESNMMVGIPAEVAGADGFRRRQRLPNACSLPA